MLVVKSNLSLDLRESHKLSLNLFASFTYRKRPGERKVIRTEARDKTRRGTYSQKTGSLIVVAIFLSAQDHTEND